MPADPEKWPGAAVYRTNCSGCHEGQVPKAPHKMFLQMMTPGTILEALDHGMMQQQAAALSGEQRRQVAEYLAATTFEAAASARSAPRCAGAPAEFNKNLPPAAVGWGYDNSRFIPANVAKLTREEVPKLEAEVGVRISGRDPRPLPADDCLRRDIHRQPRRNRLCARYRDRLRALDVPRFCRGAHRHRGRRQIGCNRAPATCISVTSSRAPTRSMRARASGCGARRSTNMRTPPSRARRHRATACSTCRSRRSR